MIQIVFLSLMLHLRTRQQIVKVEKSWNSKPDQINIQLTSAKNHVPNNTFYRTDYDKRVRAQARAMGAE